MTVIKVSKTWLCTILGTLSILSPSAQSAEAVGIVGKDDWLYTRYEHLQPTYAAPTAESVAIIGRLNKVFKAQGIAMVMTMVPIKMRIYSEHLPDEIKLSDYMAANYAQIQKSLEALGVGFVDLNTPFMSSPLRGSDTPLYFRLDSHWNRTGATLGAALIKAAIDSNPALKTALDATPSVVYKKTVGRHTLPFKGQDIVKLLPKTSKTFEPERFVPTSVVRQPPLAEGVQPQTSVTVAGSSESAEWTGFVDELRHVLQRDILNVSVIGYVGPWVGMERYLASSQFQANPPKLLIWEWPEYTLHAPPNYPYQDPRNISDNTEWLLRASAWAQTTCTPSRVNAKLTRLGLAARASQVSGNDIETGPTGNGDFVEIAFDSPMGQLDYLSVSAASLGADAMIVEGYGKRSTRRFALDTTADQALRAIKMPLPLPREGATKVRIYPGKGAGLTLKNLRVCRQPEDLLQ